MCPEYKLSVFWFLSLLTNKTCPVRLSTCVKTLENSIITGKHVVNSHLIELFDEVCQINLVHITVQLLAYSLLEFYFTRLHSQLQEALEDPEKHVVPQSGFALGQGGHLLCKRDPLVVQALFLLGPPLTQAAVACDYHKLTLQISQH